MKHFYKITFFCCAATLWMLVLASCEGGELYDVNAPEWISDKIQEIEDSKKEPEDEILEGMQEDVYTIGNINPEKPDVPLNKNDAFQKVQKRHVQEKR